MRRVVFQDDHLAPAALGPHVILCLFRWPLLRWCECCGAICGTVIVLLGSLLPAGPVLLGRSMSSVGHFLFRVTASSRGVYGEDDMKVSERKRSSLGEELSRNDIV
ncbi:hypothetical protein ACKVV1_011595 [Pyricularia oryzae]